MIVARVVMLASTWPSRSYLLEISAKLALAWLIIRLVTSVIRNEFMVRVVSLSAWLVAALSIIGQLDPTLDALDSVAIVLGGLRLTPLLLIKLGVLLAVALWLSNIASNFLESRITQSRDLTPSIQVLLVKMMRLALMVLADRHRDERGRHQSVGAGDLLRRGRRRHRFRPAEDRRQFHQRRHPAGGQIGEARRSRHHRRQFRAASAR